MGLYKYYPIPSDRMGALWTLMPVSGCSVVEYGTAGTTRFVLNCFARMGGEKHCNIYTTHLDETDIVMGQVIRLDKAVDKIVKTEKPSVLFIMYSTVASVIGTDIEAYCNIYNDRYPDTKIIYIPEDGFKGNWTLGVKSILKLLVENIPKAVNKTIKPTFNIIGSCADDFNYLSDCFEIKRILKGAFQAEPVCTMTSNTSIKDIEDMGSAHVNIVLRQEGLQAAKILEKRFGTPYILGRPYGLKGTLHWLSQISEVLKLGSNTEFIAEEENILKGVIRIAAGFTRQSKAKVTMGGHYDVIKPLAEFLKHEVGFNISDIWCSSPDRATEAIPFYKEAEWEKLVLTGEYSIIMGNAVALDLAKADCKKLQIDIPNYKFSPLKYPYSPYVGFRGAHYILNEMVK